MQKTADSKGFTIAEMAIVLIIGGGILAGALSAHSNYLKNTRIQTTEQRLAAIDEALQNFLSLNGRYPCAARLNDVPGAANFGTEIADATATLCNGIGAIAGTTEVGGTGGRVIRIGAVPTRTLGLPDDYMVDAWDNRFTFAVTSDLALQTTFDRDNGAISVLDSAGNEMIQFPLPGATAHYIVVSHGENGDGATPITGGGAGMGRFGCAAGTLEQENCDDDAVFRSTTLTSTAGGANQFDDYTRARSMTPIGNEIPVGAVMPFNLTACPNRPAPAAPDWAPFAAADGRTIIGAMTGNFNENTATTPPPEIVDFGAIPNRATWNDNEIYAVNQQGGASRMVLSYNDLGITNFLAIDPALLAGLAPAPVGSTTSATLFDSAVSPINEQTNRSPYISMIYCVRI